jgi:hypothetical protein
MVDNILPANSNVEGGLSPPLSPIDEAKSILAQIDRKVAELKFENDRNEKIVAQGMLGGKSFAGQTPIPINEDEARKKEINEFFKGTQIQI